VLRDAGGDSKAQTRYAEQEIAVDSRPVQHNDEVVLRRLANVQQVTIQPIIKATMARGCLIYTDECDIYARREACGYAHEALCHSHGEYIRDDDGHGFYEVHINTTEGFWSLPRSWLRPHRSISQDPPSISAPQFAHSVRRRGNARLGALIAALVT
jgi:transposase-like protein